MGKVPYSATGISSHLRRESKLMLWFFLGIPVALTVLALVFGPWLMNHLKIDRCLDAGGRYNEQTKTCEGEAKK